MHTPAAMQKAFMAAASAAIRVAHEGGSTEVELPDAITGELQSIHLDQAAAAQFVAGLLDALARSALNDPAIPKTDRQALMLWLAPTQQQPAH